MRRVRMTINSDYVQPIKSGYSGLVTLLQSYNSILLGKTRKAKEELTPFIHAKFSSSNFDGINILATLLKGERQYPFKDVKVDVYKISNDNLWNETLVFSKTETPTNNRSLVDFSLAELSDDLIGETTFKIRAEFTCKNIKKSCTIYLNHLGIFYNTFTLKQKIDFLEITKLDE